MSDLSNGATVKSSLHMLLIILALSAIAMIGIVFVVVFAPGEQQAGLITAVLSVTVPVVGMIVLLVKAQEAARLAERAAIHARNNGEQVALVKNQVKELQIAVDGRLTLLIKALEEKAVLKQEVGHGEGLKEGHAAGLAEADALTIARAETPATPATPVEPPAGPETEG